MKEITLPKGTVVNIEGTLFRVDEEFSPTSEIDELKHKVSILERGIAHILETTTRPVPIYIVVEQIKKIANNCLEKTNHLTN